MARGTSGGGSRTGSEGRGARRARAFVLAAAVALAAAPSHALRITYLATDLPDDAGGDLWQYDYRVSDGAFTAGWGFSILFPVGTSAGLEAVATGADGEWDVIVIQPEPLLAS